jgi:hypothetical protein
MPRLRTSIWVNPGAIVAQARASTPKICHAQEALAKPNGFLDGQGQCIRIHVSILNPCFLPVHEPHLQPAGIVARAFLLNFETRFKRNTQQGTVRAHVGFAI